MFELTKLTFLDGAMGTMLQRGGMQPGQLPELIALQDPALAVDLSEAPDVDGEQVLKATVSVSAPAFGIRLDLPGVPALFGDGFFALEPDETLDVYVTPLERADPADLRRRLVARSLFDIARPR